MRNSLYTRHTRSYAAKKNLLRPPLPYLLVHSIIKKEAKLQQKKLIDHYTHLIIHGYLHLLGYVHENKIDEKRMEAREKKILKILGIKDPYLGF